MTGPAEIHFAPVSDPIGFPPLDFYSAGLHRLPISYITHHAPWPAGSCFNFPTMYRFSRPVLDTFLEVFGGMRNEENTTV